MSSGRMPMRPTRWPFSRTCCPRCRAWWCAPGNIIPELLDLLDRRQVPVIGHGCEKGSVWVLTHLDGRWTDARRVKKKAQAL